MRITNFELCKQYQIRIDYDLQLQRSFIMKDEIKKVIFEWKSNCPYGELKSVKQANDSIIRDEFLLLFEIAMSVKCVDESEIVKVNKYFQTLTQNDDQMNSQLDLNRLKNLLRNIDSEFFEKIQKTFDRYIEKFEGSNYSELEL